LWRAAEDHIGLSCVEPAIIATACANDQIINAITVHIPRRGDGPPGIVIRRIALNDKTVRCGQSAEVDIG